MSDNPFSRAASRPDYLTPQDALVFLKRETGRPESVLAGQLKDAVMAKQVRFGFEWPKGAYGGGTRRIPMPRDIDWDALTVEADCGGMRWPSQEAAGSSKSRPARPGYAHLPLTIDRRTLETFAEELKRRAPPALVSEPKSALKVNHVDAALVTPPRPKRGLSYRADDEPLLAEMHELIKAGLERTAENAASKVASKAKGKSPAAAAIRLRKAYRRIWPRVESKRGE